MARHTENRTRLRSAALDLFASHGYDETTVDDIASRAGLSRRSFFRLFPSKEDVVFPDHDSLVALVQELLDLSPADSPVAAVCAAIRTVFESYLQDPDVALQRYQLTRTIPTLRDREIASISRYQRLVTGYLQARSVHEGQDALQAELAAASIIAAHNYVLRRWLRRGCTGQPRAELDVAFERVRSLFEADHGDRARAASPDADGATDPVVVAVFRTRQPLEAIRTAVARLGDGVAPG